MNSLTHCVYVGLCEVVADTIPHSIHAVPDIRLAVKSISGLNGAKLSPAAYLRDQGHSSWEFSYYSWGR